MSINNSAFEENSPKISSGFDPLWELKEAKKNFLPCVASDLKSAYEKLNIGRLVVKSLFVYVAF